MGDDKARVGMKVHINVVGRNREDTYNGNRSKLIDMCERTFLRILNGCYNQKYYPNKFTW